ncbi:hypothetical protein HG531_001411 [Fusarium graminearum]|nr:hypothetical protein HG531_001411 [Fusarium graminearum]
MSTRAMDILSFSSASSTSAMATSFMAGGPAGISIIAVSQLNTDNDDLQSHKELSDVLETDGQPGIEDTSILAVVEKSLLQWRNKSENNTNNGADSWRANKLSDRAALGQLDRIFIADSKELSTKAKGEHVGYDGADKEEGLGSFDNVVASVIFGLGEGGKNAS